MIQLLGKGGMGEVYLARDMTLGRKVAIKMIRRPSRLTEEEVERFLFEARATANLNHPNIVTIFQAGQHNGLPYVVMEYLKGENLRTRLLQDPPGQMEGIRLAQDVARALSLAHARQIVHQDLKPENLLIPADGRLRVVDFGLARIMERPLDAESDEDLAHEFNLADLIGTDSPAAFQGTPQYMAPEQWRRRESSGATDIWALGIVMHELFTGERPFEQFTFVELAAQLTGDGPMPLPLEDSAGQDGRVPTELSDLVAACLDRDEAKRPTAKQVVEQLEVFLRRGRSRSGRAASPFRGLAPFAEEHAELFFGRDAELLEFMEKLRHQAVLPVVGPSGAGKSSFIQAGVIPRLRERGGWTVLRIRPGGAPFLALAARLAIGETSGIDSIASIRNGAEEPEDEASEFLSQYRSGLQTLETTLAEEEALARELRDKPHMLSLALRRLAAQHGGRVLLLVDQLEELHTLTSDVQERRAFMDAICGAADEASDPVRVIFTLREDFLSRLTLGPLVRVVMGQLTVMHRPEPRALRQILTHPLELQGYRFDDDLLPARMVDEVVGEDAALPLLQFAARQLWERRDGQKKVLRRADFEAMGGVAGALASHADGVVDSLEPAEKDTAREMLLRLVTAEKTRRVVDRDVLLDGLGPGAEAVLQRLITGRLLTSRRGGGISGGIELVHESLVNTWRRLARWLEESREDLVFLEEAGRAADLWHQKGAREVGLWTGQALLEAEAALARCSTTVPERVRQFIRTGQRHRDRALWRFRMVGIAVLLVLIAASLIFYLQGEESDRQRQVAETQRRTARLHLGNAMLEGARAAEERGDLLQARAGLRGALQTEDTTGARALWMRLEQQPVIWRKRLDGAVFAVAFSPDGRWLAAGGQDRSVHLLDTVSGRGRVIRGSDEVTSVAFSPDGKKLAVGTDQGQVRLHDLAHRAGLPRILRPKGQATYALAFSQEGKLAWGDVAGHVAVWDPVSGAQKTLVTRGERVNSLAFADGGMVLAAGLTTGQSKLWPMSAGGNPWLLGEASGWAVNGLAVCPDGDTLLTSETNNLVRVWSIRQRKEIGKLTGHNNSVTRVVCGPRGELAASGGTGRQVKLWRLRDRKLLRTYPATSGPVFGLAISPDGSTLAAGGKDRILRLYRVGGPERSGEPRGHTATVNSLAFTPDGKRVVSAGEDRTVRFWEPATGRQVRVLTVTERLNAVAVSRDGEHLATAGEHGLARLWLLRRKLQSRVKGTDWNPINALSFSRDGRALASGAVRYIRVWKVKGPTTEVRLDAHRRRINGLTFSPADARLLASCGDDGIVRVWDLARAKGQRRVWELKLEKRQFTGVAFSPDGKRLAVSDESGEVHLVDLQSWQRRVLHRRNGASTFVTFHPGGGLIAAAYSDGGIDLVRVAGGLAQRLKGHRGMANSVAFSPGGALLVSGGGDRTVRAWEMPVGRPAWRAPLLIPSPPTLLSHLGAHLLDSGGEVSPATPPPGWQSEVANRARLASLSPDGETVCLATHSGVVLRLKVRDSSTLLKVETAEVRHIRALDTGCLVLDALGTTLYKGPSLSTRIHGGATAEALAGDALVLLDGQKVVNVTLGGKHQGAREVGTGGSALAIMGDKLFVGYANGSLSQGGLASGEIVAASLEHTPSSPVVAMATGPRGTLIAGYANGELGMWQLKNGKRLDHARLHGPVVHLLVKDQKLYAATELGDHLVRDLSPLYKDRCALMDDVWKRVPVVWSSGAAVKQAPPTDHPCIR